MGVEANRKAAKKAILKDPKIRQWPGLRPRTVRRLILEQQAGKRSITSIAFDYWRAKKLPEGGINLDDALAWASGRLAEQRAGRSGGA